MIINTGNRTDIPSFYSQWFYKRIEEKMVMVRNPYVPNQIRKYSLEPSLIDCLCFCTKDPQPMLNRWQEIAEIPQFWFVTITPYGRDIEPYVRHKQEILQSFRELSKRVGSHCVGWRYDPIFINDKYTVEYHLRAFETMAKTLQGSTHQCVISFIDLYKKTIKNFPQVTEVSKADQFFLAERLVEIGKKFDIEIYTCLEDPAFARFGVNTTGCMSRLVLERAIEKSLKPEQSNARQGCACLLGNDIGAYNTCLHGCLYCYANYDRKLVEQNAKRHDPDSPLLVGHVHKEDTIIEVQPKSMADVQVRLF